MCYSFLKSFFKFFRISAVPAVDTLSCLAALVAEEDAAGGARDDPADDTAETFANVNAAIVTLDYLEGMPSDITIGIRGRFCL